MTRLLLILLLIAAPVASAAQTRPGDLYRITRTSESSEKDSEGSTSEQQDTDILTERVIAVRDTGVELEYDVVGIPAAQRQIAWQYPFRVFKPLTGAPHLLNAAELQARNDRWLAAAKLPKSACGGWYFTWNAFQVECDPQKVLNIVDAAELGPASLVEGAPYKSASALAAAPLVRRNATTFTVDLSVDPEKARAGRVESDLVVAQIMRKTLTRDAAVRAHAGETITGTISITFTTDAAGRVVRRQTLTTMTIVAPRGPTTTRTGTEALERRLLTAGK